ncbi:MAG: L,D-transpeptidase [Verrucomicrobiota bacterium]
MKHILPTFLAVVIGSSTIGLSESSAETYPSAQRVKKGLFSGSRWKPYGSRMKQTRIRRAATSRTVFQARPVRATSISAPVSKPKPSPSKPTTNPYVVSQRTLDRSTRSNTKVVIDISKQRAYLLVNGQIAVRTPISSARPGKYTPRGTFSISERVRSGKVSNIYHVGMPYWMRLGSSAYGVHAGHLPGYPASAGCVRLPSSAARLIYDNTRSGTKVSIYSSWSG